MHGTTGDSKGLIGIERFSNILFAPGAVLDANKYYIVL